MRKLILVAAIAFMIATPCYANLSLASADNSANAAEQPAPVKPERSARISRHRHHHWAETPFRSYYHYFSGGC